MTGRPADAPARTDPTRLALTLLLLGSTLGVMAGSVITPVLEVIRQDLGVSGTRAGLIITAHGLAIAVAGPFAGWLVDRWGVRVPLAAGLAVYGLAGGSGLVTDTYPALIAGRVVFGAGAAVVFTATTVALFNLYRGAARDRVMGMRSTFTSLGGVAWPLLSGAVGGISWHAPFGIYVIGLPMALAALAVLPRARPAARGRPGDGRRGDGERGDGVRALFRAGPALAGLYGLQLFGAVILYSVVVFLPQRLFEVGVSLPILVAVFTASIGGTASVLGLFYAAARRRLSYAALLRAAMAAWVAAFLVLGLAGSPLSLFPATVLLGVGHGIVFPTVTTMVGVSVPERLRGRAMALCGTATFVGQFLSPLAVGPLVDATAIPTAYLTVSAVTALLLAVLTLSRAYTRFAPMDGDADAEGDDDAGGAVAPHTAPVTGTDATGPARSR
ncbi:MFS transporter [Nocardiopsis aegyptia]|uniref:MFS family permease n=1 Tax=Nocardiopsis aegyptia TaxID=220378 RepID=A0A7Z0EPW3_9ACTN|nr:MFS transporter [Nocardiopsis aegyptia]NYJ36116.1 MFS family permease [Nocardiopsis aegyptia]